MKDVSTIAVGVGEIRKGVELARCRDPRKAAEREAWLSDVVSGFGDRILPVGVTVAEERGRQNAIRRASAKGRMNSRETAPTVIALSQSQWFCRKIAKV